MSTRSDLESKIIIANDFIARGATPEEAANFAGITDEHIDSSLQVSLDGQLEIIADSNFFEDEIIITQPTVLTTEQEVFVSGGTTILTTSATFEDNARSLELQAEADRLDAKRKADQSAKVDEFEAQGLSRGRALQAASRDPDIKAAKEQERAAQLLADQARTPIGGSKKYFDANGTEISFDAYTELTADGPENIIVADNIATIAPTDDPQVAILNASDELDEFDDEDDTVLGIDPDAPGSEEADTKAALDAQKNAIDASDWRVRLHLPPGATHLYNATPAGILDPLKQTDGIIFPYTPTINVQYNANYENYDLVHSNYRGYFYKGSVVQNVIVTATFTAQDAAEANYMLATMHFLRSCTKMFYGQDIERGMPPPVVMLTGFGEYQFANHPCAVTLVSYNLPNDVDYIAAGNVSQDFNPTSNFVIHKGAPGAGKVARLSGANVEAGGIPVKGSQTSGGVVKKAGVEEIYKGVTYVPTKMDINFTMIPIQTRDQVSNDFSLKDYASGKLLKKGFW